MNHFAGKIVVGLYTVHPLIIFQRMSDIPQGAQENLMKARDERVALMNEVCCSFHRTSSSFVANVFLDTWWNPNA
jgi:hypothetical protein